MTLAALAPTASAGAPWLSCRGLTKRYGGVLALAAADLDLVPGEIHGIIGPNGAGKSTLVKVVAGAVRRDGGSVAIDGDEVDLHTPADACRHRLVLMPQEIAVVPAASVMDNVTLGAEARRWGLRSPAGCRREAERALAAVGLDIAPDATAGSLSAAHQRMLMMARALHRDARLLILDEPTAGLPQHEAELVAEAVRRLLDQRVTVLYVSHHLTEVAALCDRVTCVREGTVVTTLVGAEVTKDSLVSALLDFRAAGADAARPAVRNRALRAARGSIGAGLELDGVSGSRLRGVSLRAPRGMVTGVTGLLGSGVAELVGMLVGAQRPTAGTVRLEGEPLELRSPAAAVRRGIGYLAGDRTRAAFTTLAVRENVSIAALATWFGRLGLLRRRRERERVSASLARLSVRGDAERPLGALSGGNQQRALVARLIAADLTVLVLDEPTVGVDIRAREELWSAIRTLAQHRTVIVASSEPEELVALCDRVICIRQGAVASVLEADAITEHEITRAIA